MAPVQTIALGHSQLRLQSPSSASLRRPGSSSPLLGLCIGRCGWRVFCVAAQGMYAVAVKWLQRHVAKALLIHADSQSDNLELA